MVEDSGFRVFTVLSPGPGEEPGPKKIHELVEVLETVPVSAILTTSNSDRRMLDYFIGKSKLPLIELATGTSGFQSADALMKILVDNLESLEKRLQQPDSAG